MRASGALLRQHSSSGRCCLQQLRHKQSSHNSSAITLQYVCTAIAACTLRLRHCSDPVLLVVLLEALRVVEEVASFAAKWSLPLVPWILTVILNSNVIRHECEGQAGLWYHIRK
eukprot:17880-Heterococcus_DN1.PRE.2